MKKSGVSEGTRTLSLRSQKAILIGLYRNVLQYPQNPALRQIRRPILFLLRFSLYRTIMGGDMGA